MLNEYNHELRRDKTMKEFNVIIEKDDDGYFIASVPTLLSLIHI